MVRLALDIDGVLADSMSSWKSIAYKEGVRDPFDHKYNGIYKVRCDDGEILANKLFGEYRNEWILKSKPFPDVSDFIERIDNNEHIKYWIVTSRGEDVKFQTVEWLSNNGITGYENVLFTKNKLEAPTQVLVDDKVENVLDYQNNARLGILINRSYNYNSVVNRRVDSLLDVYNLLLKFI